MKAHSSRTLLGSLILGGALLAGLPSDGRAQMTLAQLPQFEGQKKFS